MGFYESPRYFNSNIIWINNIAAENWTISVNEYYSYKIKNVSIKFLFLDTGVNNNWINHIGTSEKARNYFEYD